MPTERDNHSEYDQQIWEKVIIKCGGIAAKLFRNCDISSAQASRYVKSGLGNITEENRKKLLVYLGYKNLNEFKISIDKELEIETEVVTEDVCQAPFYSRYHLNMPAKPEFFLGRKFLLKEIHTKLTDPSRRDNVLLLHSMGGMGKTTLMHEYLNRDYCRKYFNWIVYVSVHKNLETAFIQGMAMALQIELSSIFSKEKPLEEIIHAMQRQEGNNLVAIDNINEYDYEELVGMYWPLKKAGWKILITTRTKPAGADCIDVDELDVTDAKLLFLNHYAPDSISRDEKTLKKYMDNSNIEDDLEKLLKHIKFHTLFIELLAKTGNKKRVSPRELLDHLEKEDLRNGPKINTGAHAYHAENRLNVATLHQYMLSIFDTEYLQVETSNINLGAENQARVVMLHFFSILPSVEIPIGLLEMLWRVEEKDINEFEDRLDMLRQIGWIKGQQSFTEGLWLLSYKMHQLIQDVVYEKLKPNAYSCAILIKKITSQLQSRRGLTPDQHIVFQNYLDHAIYKVELLAKPKN
jgi:hypothetical protein